VGYWCGLLSFRGIPNLEVNRRPSRQAYFFKIETLEATDA
jgi:hypothetical protein